MDSKALRSKNINNKNKKASSKQKTNKKKKCDGKTFTKYLGSPCSKPVLYGTWFVILALRQKTTIIFTYR